jgi:hypothetical protein
VEQADELVEELVELATNSKSEMVRLAAIREFLDRMLGKAPVAVDATVAKFDFPAFYLESLKRVNGVIDGSNSTAAHDPAKIQ